MKNMLSIALSLLIAAIGFIPGGKGYNAGIISNRDKDSPTVIISVDCIEREHCTEINNLDKVTIVSEHGEDDALVGVNGPEDYEVINEDGIRSAILGIRGHVLTAHISIITITTGKSALFAVILIPKQAIRG